MLLRGETLLASAGGIETSPAAPPRAPGPHIHRGEIPRDTPAAHRDGTGRRTIAAAAQPVLCGVRPARRTAGAAAVARAATASPSAPPGERSRNGAETSRAVTLWRHQRAPVSNAARMSYERQLARQIISARNRAPPASLERGGRVYLRRPPGRRVRVFVTL